MSELRKRFINEVGSLTEQPKLLVVAVKLPSGAIETIINTHNLNDKINYYKEAYNDDFQLKTNPSVSIVGYMIV